MPSSSYEEELVSLLSTLKFLLLLFTPFDIVLEMLPNFGADLKKLSLSAAKSNLTHFLSAGVCVFVAFRTISFYFFYMVSS